MENNIVQIPIFGVWE